MTKGPKDDIIRSLRGLGDALGAKDTKEERLPPDSVRSSDAEAKQHLVEALEMALAQAKDGRIQHAVIVALGPEGSFDACILKSHEAAAMIGQLECTKQRLVNVVHAMQRSAPVKK